VNNSWFWIRAKWGGGEGGWSYHHEEVCTHGDLASKLFQQGCLSVVCEPALPGDYGARAANSQALTRDVAYT
jgi:hypothetical protein